MIEVLKEAAKVAFRCGRENNVFITIEVEPAGVCVRGTAQRGDVQVGWTSERATWAQVEADHNVVIAMVDDVAERLRTEVA